MKKDFDEWTAQTAVSILHPRKTSLREGGQLRSIKGRLARQLRHCGVLVFVALINLIASLSVSAEVSSIVVEEHSGRVLEESGADERRYPASLAKMMTLYLAFKALDSGKISLRQRFRVSRYAASRTPTKLGLRTGQAVPLQQLILGLITRSANDAAVVIAEGLFKTERAFARQMTLQARRLGMASTVFRNASGLPNRRQYTTARDMTRLARALLRDFPQRYEYFSTPQFSFRGRTYINHNRLLEDYPGVDGIKTGFTRASGFNIAASALRQGKRVVAVVLGGTTAVERDRRMIALLDTAFAKMLLVPEEQAQPTIQAAQPAGIETTTALNAPTVAALPVSDSHTRFATAGQSTPAEWSIQVGTFARREAAEKWADQVTPMDSRITPENQRIVEVPKNDGRTIFAVRFADLPATDAAEVCRSLPDDYLDCFVISPVR